MARIKRFDIVLDDGKTDYASGDVVAGHADIEIAAGNLEVTSVFVRLVCKAYCMWHEGKHAHIDKEYPLDGKRTLHGEASSRTGRLMQGNHKIRFQFRLETDSISTYNDFIGYVKYTVKLKLERPGSDSVTKTKNVIRVRQLLDLGCLHDMTGPSGGSDETSVCCGCLAGTIEGEVGTDRTGYVPGDTIVTNATLKNNSPIFVLRTVLMLALRVTYKAHGRVKVVHYMIVGHNGPKCKPGKTINLKNVQLQVPELRPTNTGLKVIKFDYVVMLHGHLRACMFDCRTSAVITIGSVPTTTSPPRYVDNTTSTVRPGLNSLTDDMNINNYTPTGNQAMPLAGRT